jgi:hypothetical protein
MVATISAQSLIAALVPAATEEDQELTLGPTKDPASAKNQSPVLGDHAFYTYYVPGAAFEAKDGTHWDIENIADTGYARIRNRWYPREEVTLRTSELRKIIHAWIEPVQQIVPELLGDSAN